MRNIHIRNGTRFVIRCFRIASIARASIVCMSVLIHTENNYILMIQRMDFKTSVFTEKNKIITNIFNKQNEE